MRLILTVISFINKVHPLFSIRRPLNNELIDYWRMRCKNLKIMIGKIHVYSIHGQRSFQIDL